MTNKPYPQLDEKEIALHAAVRSLESMAKEFQRLRQLYDARAVIGPDAFHEGVRMLLERNGQ